MRPPWGEGAPATTPPKKSPRKFPAADRATACKGRSVRVATIVAIAFAASVNPFQKEKKSERAIAARISSADSASTPCETLRFPYHAGLWAGHADPSPVLRHDVAQDVGHVLAVVRGNLEPLEDLLVLEDPHDVQVVEQGGHGNVQEIVGDVLEPIDLNANQLDVLGVLHVADHPHGLLKGRRGFDDDLRPVQPRRAGLRDLEQSESVRGGVDEVEDVVQVRGERRDVLAVDRRNEGLV